MTADRVRLLRMLPQGGRALAALLVLLQAVRAVVPAAQALAVGALVAFTSAWPALLVAALFLVDQVVWQLIQPVRHLVAKRIDGALRARVRTLATGVSGLDELESAAFQELAARAVDTGSGLGRERSTGTAAVGQLELVFRMVGAVAAAVLLAFLSIPLAAGLLALALTMRSVVRRQWMGIVGTLDADAGGQRFEFYVASQSVSGAAKDVRLYGLGNWFAGRFRAAVTRTYAPTWREMLAVLRRQWWVAAMSVVAGVAVFAGPAVAVLAGRLEPARLITFVLAGLGVLAISGMGFEAFDIEFGLQGLAAADALEARHRAAAARVPAAATARAPEVRFEDVVFTYPGADRPLLAGLTLRVPAGQTLALVGANGAGKTTLVKLLAGLYRPDSGRVTVDGREPHLEGPPVTVLFQDFVRYPASLRDNVTAGVPAPDPAGDAAVRAALDRAGASGLPDDLDASLWREGAGGTDLSGGQWQRLALARALYAVAAGRRLLVLDEPTASLDVRAEAEFHERVMSRVSGATTVLVSHRLSTVRGADRIVLLRDGRVAEDGTHDELLALGGEYARFFTTQAAAFS